MFQHGRQQSRGCTLRHAARRIHLTCVRLSPGYECVLFARVARYRYRTLVACVQGPDSVVLDEPESPYEASQSSYADGVLGTSRRTQDLEDIRALIRANRGTLNMTEVREYFRLFDREPLLEEILSELQ